MTDDQPLGHPTLTPDAATRARVLARVDATVRRRRARRRILATLPVIAVVAVVGAAIAGVLTDDTDQDPQVVMAGPGGATDELAFEPDVAWRSAVLSVDGRTLTITGGTPRHELRTCHLEVVADVVESDDLVVVGLKDAAPADAVMPEACDASLRPTTATVHLEEPLGDRPVHDALRSMTPTIHRQSDLVQVTYVPDGFEADLDDVAFGDPVNVQQTYTADGADWYFAVMEGDSSTGVQTSGSSSPVAVNDLEGVRTTGLMSGTMESIRFQLGDRTVAVWGEMQGPPTFTHADELLKVAEGIRLPAERTVDPTPTDPTPEGAPPDDEEPVAAPAANNCQGPPGSATDLEGEPDWEGDGFQSWSDRQGCLVRVDVLTDGPGARHCGYHDADTLVMSDELGERYGTADRQGVAYVRDPMGVYGLPEVTAAFEPDATLPESAVDTGYHRDGIALHVDPADPSAVWLSFPDGHVELWPLADLPPCA